MAMVPDIVKNMESYLEEEGTSRRSKNYFRFKGSLKLRDYYKQVNSLGPIKQPDGCINQCG